MDPKNLRKNTRCNIRLPVPYINLFDIKRKINTGDRNFIPERLLGYAMNISENGIYLITPIKPFKEDLLELNISFPFKDKVRRFTFNGVVRWCNWSKYKRPNRFQEFVYEAGIEFDLDSPLRDIGSFVRYLRSIGLENDSDRLTKHKYKQEGLIWQN